MARVWSERASLAHSPGADTVEHYSVLRDPWGHVELGTNGVRGLPEGSEQGKANGLCQILHPLTATQPFLLTQLEPAVPWQESAPVSVLPHPSSLLV